MIKVLRDAWCPVGKDCPRIERTEGGDYPWLTQRRTSPGDMLRVQTLERYGVPSDDADFVGYLEGAPAPTSPYREPFFQELRDGVAAQMRWRNLHLIRQPLSDYLRYAFEWVYT